ncbi:two-component system, chemotaxis family, sensor kinase CheA [Sphingomonas laterariae]|uniref:Chemotaxis protein CheA n=1 Tax=Edaphosphingomonas laterariae TaxID=861865 RepID=A0A239E4C2_9SPHN|nr:chemotaxis protein CheW [Sphingomonas laterariae]SNS39457.1 two-component system, chemotaxis family, sensor kinase CheA [Sphingomonas laterariae]
MDDLLQEFLAETREMLAAISGEIITWEAEPGDRARLDSIFRFVHTVKGSCGFLDLPRLERLSHAAEDALAEVRSGERQADVALVNAVLAIIDRIGELTEAIEAGESLPDEDDHRLINALVPGSAAPAAVAPQAVSGSPIRTVSRSIRLPIDLLDRMMGGVSDMVLARNELSRKLRDSMVDGAIEAAFERLSLCVAEMRDAITRTRMQRIDHIFSVLPRMVRDLSAELGKTVALEVEGGDVELDREMIEMIRDPLTHIIRNAIDHGVELPDDRRALGKPVAGRLIVSARQAGNQILIEVIDDGRGIDGERLVAKAIAAGIVTPERAESLTWTQKLALVFEPGLSTAQAISAISGRGVGMDVVRSNVERIGGLVDIESRLHQGARLTLRVPLTLTIIPALTVSAGGQTFAIPRSAIEEIVRATGDGVRLEPMGGVHVAAIRGRRMPVVPLGKLTRGASRPVSPPTLVVLRPAGGALFALSVDAVHDHEELVVKPAAPAVMATGIYAGTTLPDNGRPMLLLDPAGIASVTGVASQQVANAEPDAVAEEAAPLVQTLLFRDSDGIERAIRLSVVERIEEVPASAARFSAGRLRIAHNDQLLPLLGHADPSARTRLRVLRVSDGETQLAYMIDEVIDIVALPPLADSAVQPGPVAGVVMVEGRQVELLDPHWLLADAAGGLPQPSARPICLLVNAEDRWMSEILRPLVEAAGYRVVVGRAPADSRPDVIIDTGGPHAELTDGGVPVVRLRTAPAPANGADDSIYRYDRIGLLAALDGVVAARR